MHAKNLQQVGQEVPTSRLESYNTAANTAWKKKINIYIYINAYI